MRIVLVTMWFCAVTLKNIFRFAGYKLDQMYFINYWDSLRGSSTSSIKIVFGEAPFLDKPGTRSFFIWSLSEGSSF